MSRLPAPRSVLRTVSVLRIVPARVVAGVALAVGLAVLAGSPARAQMESREGIALQNQILELRHELEQLRAQGGAPQGGAPQAYAPPAYAPPAYGTPPAGGEGGSNDITATLLARVTQLEEQVRELRGRIDEVDNARQQAEADLSKQIGDLQFKLTGGAGVAASPPPGQTLSPQPGVLGGRPPAPPPPAAPVRRTPEMALAAGNAALARRDYPAAEAAAREVLASGRGPRSADGQFLLAQSLAGERNFAAAAIAYDDSFKRNTRGYRAPDSLLGLANSLNLLGDKKAACAALDSLHAQFPTVRPDLRPSIAAARGRAGCR